MVKVTATSRICNIYYSASGPYFAFMSSTVARTPQTPPRAIATPCVKVCVVDGASGLCLGCWRTLSEIGGWAGMTDEARAVVMAELPGRAAKAGQ